MLKPVSASLTKTLLKDIEDSLSQSGPSAGSPHLQDLLEAVKASLRYEQAINKESVKDFRWSGFVTPRGSKKKKHKVSGVAFLFLYYYILSHYKSHINLTYLFIYCLHIFFL